MVWPFFVFKSDDRVAGDQASAAASSGGLRWELAADSAGDILEIFRAFHQVGVTVVIATHDPVWMTRFAPRLLRLERGLLVGEGA